MPFKPEDLARLPFLGYENGRSRPILEFKRPDQTKGFISPPQPVRASNGDFLSQMVLAGMGFMAESEFVVEPYVKTGDLVEVLQDHDWFGLSIYAVFPPGRCPTRRVRMFVQCLQRALLGHEGVPGQFQKIWFKEWSTLSI